MSRLMYVVALTDEERDLLNRIVKEGTENPRTIMRARILLMSDKNADVPKMTKEELASYLGTTHTTIQTTREEYANGGIEKAIYRKKVEHRARKFDDNVVDSIVRITKENPPEGKKRWSLRLLCSECTKRGITKSISADTVALILKEHDINLKE